LNNAERPGLGVRAFLGGSPGAGNLCQGENAFFLNCLGGMCSSDVQHNAAIDRAGVHPLEDIVDVFEPLGL
jgi:hypothetical protein